MRNLDGTPLGERFTCSTSKDSMKQMNELMDETRFSRSEIVRLAIDLLYVDHRANPKKYLPPAAQS